MEHQSTRARVDQCRRKRDVSTRDVSTHSGVVGVDGIVSVGALVEEDVGDDAFASTEDESRDDRTGQHAELSDYDNADEDVFASDPTPTIMQLNLVKKYEPIQRLPSCRPGSDDGGHNVDEYCLSSTQGLIQLHTEANQSYMPEKKEELTFRNNKGKHGFIRQGHVMKKNKETQARIGTDVNTKMKAIICRWMSCPTSEEEECSASDVCDRSTLPETDVSSERDLDAERPLPRWKRHDQATKSRRPNTSQKATKKTRNAEVKMHRERLYPYYRTTYFPVLKHANNCDAVRRKCGVVEARQRYKRSEDIGTSGKIFLTDDDLSSNDSIFDTDTEGSNESFESPSSSPKRTARIAPSISASSIQTRKPLQHLDHDAIYLSSIGMFWDRAENIDFTNAKKGTHDV